MAHFAEIDNNNIVLRVLVIDNSLENRGLDFLANELGLGGVWLQTSYNTRGGVYYNPNTNQPSSNQSKALRKNMAVPGMIYDDSRDAFYVPQPYPSWILNETTCYWESPVLYPNDDKFYVWNEENQSWDGVE